MDFLNSKTKDNLMRAFAGESQARNRYTFAAEFAREHGLYTLADMFLFTADQERAHAQVFWGHMKEMSGKNINIEGGYPVEVFDNMADILRAAQHDEYSEYESVYPSFAKAAVEEGFPKAAASFTDIAKIEKIHGDRFGELLKWVEEDKLFKDEMKIGWFCTNCGHIHYADEAPEVCPVCKHARGYFIRQSMIPYTNEKIIML